MEWISIIFYVSIIISLLVINYILYTRNENNKISLQRLEIENNKLKNDLEIKQISLRHKENMNMDLYTNIHSRDQEIKQLKSKSLNYTITPINNYKKWK